MNCMLLTRLGVTHRRQSVCWATIHSLVGLYMFPDRDHLYTVGMEKRTVDSARILRESLHLDDDELDEVRATRTKHSPH